MLAHSLYRCLSDTGHRCKKKANPCMGEVHLVLDAGCPEPCARKPLLGATRQESGLSSVQCTQSAARADQERKYCDKYTFRAHGAYTPE